MRIALLVIALLLGAAAVSAAPDPKAAAHYKQGKAFLDAKEYDQAIREFQAAYAIDKVASHLFNIGKAYDAKGDYDNALVFYQKYLDAEPGSARAAEVRGLIVAATKARDDAAAKKKAEEEAARIAADKLKQDEERKQKQIAAAARTKNAEAFATAGAWLDAGNEHRGAFELDGDPKHLLAAAEAYRKAPDLVKARDAYRAYIDKVPEGTDKDAARFRLAETIKAIEKMEADERERKLREEQLQRERDRDRGREKPSLPPHKSFKRGWIVVGGALLLGGLVADLAAPNADNGALDVSDFSGPMLYGLGSLAVLRGVF